MLLPCAFTFHTLLLFANILKKVSVPLNTTMTSSYLETLYRNKEWLGKRMKILKRIHNLGLVSSLGHTGHYCPCKYKEQEET